MNELSRIAAALIVAAALNGCGNKESEATEQVAPTAFKPKAAAAVSSSKGPNWATPLDKYQSLNEDGVVALLYAALKGDPINYRELSTWMSDAYVNVEDAFKKHEIEESLKPKIDQRIQNFKNSRYVFFEEPLTLNEYDFRIKGFALSQNLAGVKARMILFWRRGDRIALTNNRADAFLSVPNIERAKEIDQLRKTGKLEDWTAKSYGYATGAGWSSEIGHPNIGFDIHKVIFLDDKKNVVGEFLVPE